MGEKKRVPEGTPQLTVAKLQKFEQNPSDLAKVYRYFREIPGGATRIDCFLSTGILESSINWYVGKLLGSGLLREIRKGIDAHTKQFVKFYSADPAQWKPERNRQLSLFEEEEGGHYGI